MKTTRILMIISVLAFAMVSLTANADGYDNKSISHGKIVYLNIEDAFLVPGLVEAMNRQLDGDFLSQIRKTYTVKVLYMHLTYRITGTYEQWVSFFYPKWMSSISSVSATSNYNTR